MRTNLEQIEAVLAAKPADPTADPAKEKLVANDKGIVKLAGTQILRKLATGELVMLTRTRLESIRDELKSKESKPNAPKRKPRSNKPPATKGIKKRPKRRPKNSRSR